MTLLSLNALSKWGPIFAGTIFLSWTAVEIIRWFVSPEPLIVPLHQVDNLSVRDFSRTPDGISFRVENPGASQLVVTLEQRVKGVKLRLRFNSIDKTVKLINVFPSRDGRGYSIDRRVTTRTLPLSKTYEFDLSGYPFDKLQIDFQTNGIPAAATLSSISLHSVHAFDRGPFRYALALLAAILIVLPGTLIYGLFGNRDAGVCIYSCSVFALSLLFYTGLFVCLLIAGKVVPDHMEVLVLTAFILGVLILVILTVLLRRVTYIVGLVKQAKIELIGYCTLALVACYIVSHDTELPLANVHYQSISGPKTYQMFRAHDNYFQFLNGKIIADRDSFEKYYGDRRTRKLFYLPEEREMYPGALYAVFRAGMSALSPYVGESYLTYTLLGTCFNLMVLFPLLAFARKYFPDHSLLLFAAAISLNGFALTNYYFTWFKFAGAALFLSALFFLVNDHKKPTNWAAAGLLFGLGANMHGGNVLGIPLYFLLFVYRSIRTYTLRNWRWMIAAVLLIVVFALTNLPYSMVKQLYFTEQHTLFKTFFLAGLGHPDGLWASVKLFFETIPLEQQLPVRLENLAQLFRVDPIIELVTLVGQVGWYDYTAKWNGLEFARLTLLFFPSFFFLTLGWLYVRVTGHRRAAQPADQKIPAPSVLILTGFLTFALIMFMNYSRHATYFSHSHPMGVILLIHLLLVGLILQCGTAMSRLYGVYLGFSAIRLFTHL